MAQLPKYLQGCLPEYLETDLRSVAKITDKQLADFDRDQRAIMAEDAVHLAKEVLRLRLKLKEKK